MTSTDNAYTATGNGVREDFLALATDNGHRRPTTGFQTREVSGNNFWFGGSFGGSIQGVYGARVEDPGSSILQRIFAGVYGASDSNPSRSFRSKRNGPGVADTGAAAGNREQRGKDVRGSKAQLTLRSLSNSACGTSSLTQSSRRLASHMRT